MANKPNEPTEANPVPLIELREVTKIYGGETLALNRLSLSINSSDFIILTGPSGAGKTTCLKTIFAAERPDDGHIFIAGRDILRLKRSSIPYLRRNIGVVFQDFKLLEQRSVLQNVAVALEIRGVAPKEVRRQSFETLAAVGLAKMASWRVEQLSGGEQQRVAIARAIVGQPAILLADEPTGNLDPELTCDILRLFNRIAAQGTAVVLATHDPLVIENANWQRLWRLENGCIVYHQEQAAKPMTPSDAPDLAKVVPFDQRAWLQPSDKRYSA